MDFSNHPLNVNVNTKTINNVNVKPVIDKLRIILNDTHSDGQFAQIARSLPEAFIWTQAEIAQTKRNPAAWFTAVCKANMR